MLDDPGIKVKEAAVEEVVAESVIKCEMLSIERTCL